MPEITAKALNRPPLGLLLPPLLIALSVAFWWRYHPRPELPPMTEQALLRLAADTDFHNLDPTPAPLPWEHYTIAPGDYLTHLWKEQWQLPAATLYRLIETAEHGELLNRLRPGQHLEWRADSDGNLLALRLWENEARGYQWNLDADSIRARPLEKARTSHRVRITGVVQSSLGAALAAQPALAGAAGSVSAQLAELLPLGRQARRGDRFSVLVDVENLEGSERAYSAKLMGFDYQGARLRASAARFDDDRFYKPDGTSLLPSFWRYPYAQNLRYRISSPFNLHRHHPITGRISPHYGTDFAMPVGTAVEAPADGVVRRATRGALAGNYLVLDHGNGYQTRYMHLSKLLVHAGDTVEQGQVIADSGNTGRSTGPHLHYELRLNGRPVNAMEAALPTKGQLAKDELTRFRNQYAAYFDFPADANDGTEVAHRDPR
ncbi:MAG: peptidoglycan DD-metalloendopeptidase family protein [Alcanivorax sp.]|uniref:peptidoglycan DD-metalloendopeptidase family protein n=1 Tax=Alloalcanivorax marinus TaxID=1177169 RepID=UPI00195831B0|nr:peptidoglycan DD-metalloendopeptidase family protein [Alloalcanivorax marinus]MBM7333308.1 peptidoglycan DD-metalloendopeptidase family protein [Alloalcanivorax marinus]